MILPQQVRVGYLNVKVQLLSLGEARKHDIDGSYDHPTATIEVDESLCAPAKADTLLHEMLHAMCKLGSVGLDDAAEERVVRVLTTQLLGAMRDNPKVFADMIGAVSG